MSSDQHPDGGNRPGRQWDRKRIISAGPIDIKTHYSETQEDIIERVRTCLK